MDRNIDFNCILLKIWILFHAWIKFQISVQLRWVRPQDVVSCNRTLSDLECNYIAGSKWLQSLPECIGTCMFQINWITDPLIPFFHGTCIFLQIHTHYDVDPNKKADRWSQFYRGGTSFCFCKQPINKNNNVLLLVNNSVTGNWNQSYDLVNGVFNASCAAQEAFPLEETTFEKTKRLVFVDYGIWISVGVIAIKLLSEVIIFLQVSTFFCHLLSLSKSNVIRSKILCRLHYYSYQGVSLASCLCRTHSRIYGCLIDLRHPYASRYIL